MDDFKTWDIFISYASEDKDTLARPLAYHLAELGLRVWFDEDVLRVGDSISRSIDAGLKSSAFGVVILSRSFFNKQWTLNELAALLGQEQPGRQKILPIWHSVSAEDVKRLSPVLADRVALHSRAGVDELARRIHRRVFDELNSADGSRLTFFGETGRMRLHLTESTVQGEYDWYDQTLVGSLDGHVSSHRATEASWPLTAANLQLLRFGWTWTLDDKKGSGLLLRSRSTPRYGLDDRLVGGWWFEHTTPEVTQLVAWAEREAASSRHVRDVEKPADVFPWSFARRVWDR